MPTDKQREAARRNGAKSRGPKTPEGKAASSRNALRHACCAGASILLPHESQEDYDNLFQDFMDRFQPIDTPERCLLEQMVIATWLLRRAWEAESYVIFERVDDTRSLVELYWDRPAEATYQMVGFGRAVDAQLCSLQRYAAHHERSYQRAARALRDLQSHRPPVPADTALDTVPESRPTPNQKLRNEPTEALTPAASTLQPAAQALRSAAPSGPVYGFRVEPAVQPVAAAPQAREFGRLTSPRGLKMCA